MNVSEINRQNHIYIKWLKDNASKIPNCSRLIKQLESNKKVGHIIHAELVKRFVENGEFEITDIEVNGQSTDVDIEINRSINIQVWYGASVSSHYVKNRKKIKKFENKISPLGGVETDWNKDKETIFKKLEQLPNNNFGLLICLNDYMGIMFLPEWGEEISDNKALAEVSVFSFGNLTVEKALLHHSENFKYSDLAVKVLKALKIYSNL